MIRLPAHILLCFIVGSSFGSRGQEARPTSGKISAAEILQRNLIATGGLEAHQKLQSLFARGEFGVTPDHPSGHYTFSYKAPSSDVLEMNEEGQGTLWTGRRAGQRFSRLSREHPAMTGVAGSETRLPSLSIEIIEQDWLSLLEWDFSHGYEKIELIGRETVDKKLTYAVQMTPAQGEPVVRYYDCDTFLQVAMDQVQRLQSKNGQQVAYRMRSYFRDYRNQEGLKVPRVIAVRKGGDDLLFRLTKFQPNAKIEDSVFKVKR